MKSTKSSPSVARQYASALASLFDVSQGMDYMQFVEFSSNARIEKSFSHVGQSIRQAMDQYDGKAQADAA